MAHEENPQQVCILWHASDRAPAGTLIGALSGKGLSVTLADSAHRAFAAARVSARTAKRVVLVLDDRDSLAQVDRVLDALDRFAPGVICWVHREGVNPPVAPVVRTGAAAAPQAGKPPAGAPEQGASSRPLRLVGKDDPGRSMPRSAPTGKPGASVNAREVLNADELDALLAGEMGDERRGK